MKISAKTSTDSITFKTKDTSPTDKSVYKWWLAKDDAMLSKQMLTTVNYLKEGQAYRQKQAAIFARLYGNMSLFSFIGSSMTKMDKLQGLPVDRPTFNLIQSAVDTLVSRIGQERPAPMFLTDNSDYRERRLAKQLNNFILGEFYQTKAYEKAVIMLRDALVEGDGILHVFQTEDNKVGLERVLLTELFTDLNESMYHDPRQMYRIKLVDRDVLKGWMDSKKAVKAVDGADSAFPDSGSDSSKTVSDLVMVVEGWHLPSFKGANDGRHTIACSAGILIDEPYTKERFPFVFLHFSERLLGFWSQGLAEQLMGTQLEINSLLHTISKAIRLVGIPRVFVEKGSKVAKASFNNDIGSIVEYSGTKPVMEVPPVVPQELYAQLERLINFGYQQSGVSAMQAGAQKPAGLDSGEAQRVYDDISTDRYAALARKFDNIFIDLAYLMIDLAKDIAEETGSYQTVYPNKDGTKQIDLPKMTLLQDPFVIQCFNTSSLPKDPAGRMSKVAEMIQSGMITVKEGRRLLDYPDLSQMEKLANASEERIFQLLDKIVEDGNYTPPDTFLDLDLANELTVQYINLYGSAKLEESRMQMLRNFFVQIQDLKQAAMPPAPPQAPGMPAQGAATPQANPEPTPTSNLVPNGAQG